MLTPYPPEMPDAEALQLVLDAWKNKAVDPKPTARVAWNLVGYGLGQWDTGLHGVAALKALPVPSEEKIDEAFALAMKAHQSGDMKAFPIPWAILAQVALAILQRYFGS